eukprot:RCo038502
MLHVRKVKPLACDICGNQNVLCAGLEGLDCKLPLFLTLAPVNRHRVDALQEKVLMDVVHVGLVLAEHQHRGRRLLQALKEIHNLCLLLNVLHLLDDVQVGRTGAAHIDHDMPHQRRLSKLLHFPRHRCGEKQGLPLLLEEVEDFPDFIFKAHVHQPVRLIQHKKLANVEVDPLLGEEVDQATWGGNHTVDAAMSHLHLVLHVQAPDQQGMFQPWPPRAHFCDLAVVQHHVIGLPCQLAAGTNYQADRALPGHEGHSHLLLKRLHDHREDKHQRLSRPGKGNADHVSPHESRRQTLKLDGSGLVNALPGQLFYNLHGKSAIFKGSNWGWNIFSVHKNVKRFADALGLLLGHFP